MSHCTNADAVAAASPTQRRRTVPSGRWSCLKATSPNCPALSAPLSPATPLPTPPRPTIRADPDRKIVPSKSFPSATTWPILSGRRASRPRSRHPSHLVTQRCHWPVGSAPSGGPLCLIRQRSSGQHMGRHRSRPLGHRNRNHYVRDVSCDEDRSRIRDNPGIIARARSFALNIIRHNGVTNVAQALWLCCK
jgi:hypothetical protein